MNRFFLPAVALAKAGRCTTAIGAKAGRCTTAIGAKAGRCTTVIGAKAGLITAIIIALGGLLPPALPAQNFFAVDKLALNTPSGKTVSTKILADYLCAGQPDDAHKARAIYAWVTLNILYVDSTDERELWATPEYIDRQRPERVLQNRTAVCQGYANLFCALAKEAGLPCEVVTGLVKNAAGDVAQIGHAWVAVRIGEGWRLFDPTWGAPPAGMSRWKVMDKYFMAGPTDFVLQHLPDDPVWQLLGNPVTERRFRQSTDAEILDFLQQDQQGEFNFQDTLNHWFSMDSTSRLFASEGRILRFNGSNERVIYGLGQSYWGLFFELFYTLDSISDQAIMTETLEIDTMWFAQQFELLEHYHNRSRHLFDQLETPERLDKTEKFYTPKDVAALLDKLQGDMRTGVFEYMDRKMPEGVLEEIQIARLQYQMELAHKYYQFAAQKMDCKKMAGNCFDIPHNRSLMAIQLGRHQVRFAQDLANEHTAAKSLKTIGLNLQTARDLFLQAIVDCEQMRNRPPHFAFVEDRIAAARQGLFTLRTCQIRVERTALSPEFEAVMKAQKFPARKGVHLEEKMLSIAQSIAGLKDTLNSLTPELGTDFARIALFNTQLENFTLLLNLANLQYRIALNEYDLAMAKNNLSGQREPIRKRALLAQQTLTTATAVLDVLEDSGRLPAASIDQKHLRVHKLAKALKGFLDGL